MFSFKIYVMCREGRHSPQQYIFEKFKICNGVSGLTWIVWHCHKFTNIPSICLMYFDICDHCQHCCSWQKMKHCGAFSFAALSF